MVGSCTSESYVCGYNRMSVSMTIEMFLSIWILSPVSPRGVAGFMTLAVNVIPYGAVEWWGGGGGGGGGEGGQVTLPSFALHPINSLDL